MMMVINTERWGWIIKIPLTNKKYLMTRDKRCVGLNTKRIFNFHISYKKVMILRGPKNTTLLIGPHKKSQNFSMRNKRELKRPKKYFNKRKVDIKT